MQRVAEIHIVKGNLKLLREASDVIVLLPADKKARTGNTDGIVYSSVIAKIVALVIMHLLQLVHRPAHYVCNACVLDEISISAPTTVCEFRDGWYRSHVICPEDFGLQRADRSAILGGTAAENAAITLEVLRGGRGPRRDIVLLNAGAGLYVADKAGSIAEGVKLAADVIDSGAALRKLEEFKLASTL